MLSIFQHGVAEIKSRHHHRGLRGLVLAHRDSVLVHPRAGHRACRPAQLRAARHHHTETCLR